MTHPTDPAAEATKPKPSPFRISDLSDDDKPREKALRNGIRSLSDTELMALLLGGGVPGKSVLELSQEIYGAYGRSLSQMAQASVRDMCSRFKGVGPAKAITLAAALELGGRRKDVREQQRPQIKSSTDAYDIIRGQLENLPTEEFWVILLSRANRVINTECISRGGTGATVVEPKIVMKRAIEHLASAIILAHNHPSGQNHPSPQDDTLTRRIKQAGEILDIRVLDHIIVTPTTFYSYSDNSKL